MARLKQTKGFTMIECLFVLTVISVLYLLAIPVADNIRNRKDVNTIMDEMALRQIEAIMECDYSDYDNDEYDIHVTYNRKGNVLQADSYQVGSHNMIVSLGTGRTYVKD
ncbi:MAG: prepilin-type N-terminal cleavage/methylation domain-containing protein [Erysipelotrichaceae bacterium]|nr:prepilin-type N-terminal cleavage/methylation domain-containing protein [Erysipelotrichaceae bacterium]